MRKQVYYSLGMRLIAFLLSVALLGGGLFAGWGQAEAKESLPGIPDLIVPSDAGNGRDGAMWNHLHQVYDDLYPVVADNIRVTPDGRYVGFIAYQYATGPAGGELHSSLMLFDRESGSLVTVLQVQPSEAKEPLRFSMSADARWFAFSGKTRLMEDAYPQVYVYDRKEKALTLVSKQPSGLPADGLSDNPSISADGRFIAYESDASDIVGDDAGNIDIIVYDRDRDANELISSPANTEDPDEAASGNSEKPSISADGRYVAFESSSAYLVEGDDNGNNDVFVYDRQTKQAKLISAPAPGGRADRASGAPSISANGAIVAFESYAPLAADDTNDEKDIYVYRESSPAVQRVSVDENGGQNAFESYQPLLSADGKYLSFESWPETTEFEHAMIADLTAGTVRNVSVANAGKELTDPLTELAISEDGAVAAFNAGYPAKDPQSGEEFTMVGLFIAAKTSGDGQKPTWPNGSKLEAQDVKTDSITLAWTPASHPKGIKAYRVYKNGERIDDVNGTALTYTATGLRPATEYDFRIEAVGADDVATAGGPSLRVSTAADDRTLDVSAKFDRLSPKRLPVLGGNLTIEAKAKTGRMVTAKIAYADWLDESGERLPVPRSAQTTVNLIEKAPGTGSYAGFFPLKEGVAELTSVTAVMTGAAGGPVEKPVAGLPVKVAGNVKVAFVNPGEIDLNGAYLVAVNQEDGGSTTVTLKNGDPIVLSGVSPGDKYNVTLYASGGRGLGELTDLRIAAGTTTELTLEVLRSARFRFKVTDQDNKPVSGIGIEVWNEVADDYVAGYTTDGEGLTAWTETENVSKTLTAKVDVSNSKYETLPKFPFTLKPGDTVIPVTIARSPEGKLQGKVLTAAGAPVFNALVTATQIYKGEPVVQKVFTDMNGSYEFTLYAGEVAIQAAQSSYHYNSEAGLKAVVEKDKATTLNIPVRMAESGMVTFNVYVKTVGGQWQGPVDMEQMRFRTDLRTKFGGRSSYYQNAVQLQGQPGEEVQACVSGVLSGPFEACKTIVLDDKASGTVELRIEENGGVLTGTVDADGSARINANLYEVVGDDLVYANSGSFNKGRFELYAKKAGTYRLEFNRRDPATNQMATAFKQVVIREQETLDVGTIALQPAGYFYHVTANGFMAQPSEVVPGGTVNLRAFYQNHGSDAVSGATLKIVLPEGVSPVTEPGGTRIPVKLNGAAATAVRNGNTVEVPLGSVEKRAQGTVVLQAKLDAGFEQGKTQLSARIEGTAGGAAISESLGLVQLEVPRVSIEAPAQAAASTLQVMGVAPAGSEVRIYDDNLLLGMTQATAGGTWKSGVELTNADGSDIHLLWVEAESGARKLRSDRKVVAYRQNEPVLQQIALAQHPNGKWLQLNVDQGVAQLPYTVVPGNPFAFILKFSEPDKVKNARIYLGGQIGGPVTAEKGADGLFRATVPTTSGALGGIHVDFDTVKPKVIVSRDIPTEEETRNSLPAKMKNFDIVEKTPFQREGNAYTGSAVFEFPDLPGYRLEAKQTIGATRANYRPTVEEIVEAEAAGLLMYNVSMDVKEDGDRVNVKVKGYVPGTVFFPDFGAASRSASFATLDDGGFDPLEALDELGIDPTPYQKGMIEVTHEYSMLAKDASAPISDIKEQYEGYRDYAGKITKIMDNVEAATLCPENMEATGEQAGKALLVTVGGEIAKTAIGAWTGAMMLEGPLGAVGGFAGKYVSNKIDSYVDEQIDKVKTVGPTNPQSCEADENYDDYETENIYKKRLRRVYAKPKWIYDPSGYVYEAVPSNRLTDVKATVLFQDKASGEWKVWTDAPSYGQINPQLTDGEGRYGWDVPEGKWKVVWEKNGYQTMSSAELIVPPPHFDVNAGLISTAPPIVSGIEAVIGKESSFIDIDLSKYVKTADPIATGSITVTGPDGAALEGTVAYAELQESGQGPLSRKVRFTPSGDGLQEGADYTVSVQPQSFTSYAGAKMLAGDERAVRAVRRDAEGPVPVSAELIGGNRVVRLAFNEPLAAGTVLNPESFELTGTTRSILSAVVQLPEGGEKPQAVVLTLSGALPEGANISVRAAAGATADPAGNPSEAKTLTFSGADASLSALAIEGGALTEPFAKDKIAYTVKVAEQVASFQLKATAAAGGKMSIRGVPLAGDAFKTIEIPSDGIVQIRVEAANRPDVTKTYTLHIVRTSQPGPGPDTGSGSGGGVPIPSEGGDKSDIGKDAEVAMKTTEQGRKQAVVSVKSATVLAAIKSAASGGELYVQIPSGSDAYDVVLPSDAFRALAEAKTKLRLKGDTLSIIVQPDAWASGVSGQATAVHFAIDRASAQEEQAWLDALRVKFAGLTAATGMFRFAAAAAEGERQVQLSASRTDAVIAHWTQAGESAALYRYNKVAQQWIYAADLPNAKGLPLGGENAESNYFGALTYASVFADIDGHWAEDAIDWMAARLFVSGVTARSFEPNRQVTRAEFAAMLARIVGGQPKEGSSSPFEDVQPASWYYDAVRVAYDRKLITGDGSGKFHPDAYVTREQMTAMSWRAYRQLAEEAADATEEEAKRLLQPYFDAPAIDGWARSDVASSIKAGLVQGISQTRFEPDRVATRAQAATVLRRLAEKLGLS
ncbi:S-layer homology domain-containing protein [Paenibacillus aurantiacus]|uniref:S-layer homology domain-containing protein n=1 Tax=Paenibacillus aurantiacus TaxID=1936118 RepID=A0ABV5KIE7_9BACL